MTDEDPHVIHDIWDTYQSISESSPSEIYNYASHSLDEAHSLFKHGVMSLQEKAKVEQLFTAICFEIQQMLDETNPIDSELQTLINERMAAKIFCNLSFFNHSLMLGPSDKFSRSPDFAINSKTQHAQYFARFNL